MLYNSTQNAAEVVSSAQAIAQGISKDGGLFVPQEFPKYDENTLKALLKSFGRSCPNSRLSVTIFSESALKVLQNSRIPKHSAKAQHFFTGIFLQISALAEPENEIAISMLQSTQLRITRCALPAPDGCRTFQIQYQTPEKEAPLHSQQ